MREPAPAGRGDWIVLAAILAIVAATVLLAHLLPEAGRPRAPSTQSLSDREPTCAEWTDGCVVCQRTDQGPSCSTPGIACVRGELRCLRRDGV